MSGYAERLKSGAVGRVLHRWAHMNTWGVAHGPQRARWIAFPDDTYHRGLVDAFILHVDGALVDGEERVSMPTELAAEIKMLLCPDLRPRVKP